MPRVLFHTLIIVIAILPRFALSAPPVGAVGTDQLLQEEKNLQEQWHELERKQAELHAQAEKVRERMCNAGVTEKCKPKSIFVTSYNNEVAQTDSSPCSGAAGNVCDAFSKGMKPLALSRDLLKVFPHGTKVTLKSDIPQCNGVWTVMDTLSAYKRLKNGAKAPRTLQADLFFPKELKKTHNTSCHATISKS